MSEKKIVLNTVTYRKLVTFSRDELDTFKKMCKLCIRFRYCDEELSLNKAQALYFKLLALEEK